LKVRGISVRISVICTITTPLHARKRQKKYARNLTVKLTAPGIISNWRGGMNKTFAKSMEGTYTACSVMPDTFVMKRKMVGKMFCFAHEYPTEEKGVQPSFPPELNCSNCEFYLGTKDE